MKTQQVKMKNAKWGLTGVLLVLWLGWATRPALAQQPATPIPINPPTATATAPPPTDPPTRTPTSLGPASAEAVADGTNVRSQPDIAAERLGQIAPGRTYAIIGRRFEWLQIQFPDAPGGVGWVHESVVQISGDPALIPDFSLENLPTENATVSSGRATAEFITATPGGVLTLTALAQITPTGVFTLDPVNGAPQAANVRLPTYTFPAITDTPINLGEFVGVERSPVVSADGLPPIVPVVGLLGLGGLGLLLSVLRRL